MPNTLTRRDEESFSASEWDQISDDLLYEIFSRFTCGSLLKSSQVCRKWHRLSLDEFIWQRLFQRDWTIDRSIELAPGHSSWRLEYKRLYYHTPREESEVLRDHRDQVLHVCFSHNGKFFSTTSKDGFVKVWSSGYPARVVYYSDMRELTWKYTQYSQFNETDTLLLVSGVHFGSHSTSGEIAVFNLEGGFELQCRVLNKPYDIFGTWYNSASLLSGNLHWLGHLTSCSVLWLNKASQELQSELESVVCRLYKFRNVNASSIRTIMVAKCPDETPKNAAKTNPDISGTSKDSEKLLKVTMTECSQSSIPRDPKAPSQRMQVFCDDSRIQLLEVDAEDEQCVIGGLKGTIEYNAFYRQAESTTGGQPATGNHDNQNKQTEMSLDSHMLDLCHKRASDSSPSINASSNPRELSQVPNLDRHTFSRSDAQSAVLAPPRTLPEPSSSSAAPSPVNQNTHLHENLEHKEPDKYLIFTTGKKTYTPHQIGIKRVRHKDTAVLMDRNVPPQDPQQPDAAEAGLANGDEAGLDDPLNDFDELDHIIEIHGHIIGMCLSPDQRYLYVNSRTWPQGYEIDDPLYPPPIAQEIDIHVIDLLTMEEVGTMHRAHKAYTPNDECFFIFLDVCNEYVASGAEDHHGYLWDRHYGICLCQYPHSDVVNCVAFNPADPECLITVSDDHLLKVWRSRNRMNELKLSKKT